MQAVDIDDVLMLKGAGCGAGVEGDPGFQEGNVCAGDGGGGVAESGLSAASLEIAEKYKDEQAWNEPIQEMMEANGLTLEDYQKVNDALYKHNLASGDQSDELLTSLWESDEPEGRAMRVMSDWQEWQIEATRERRKDNIEYDVEAVKKRVERNRNDWAASRGYFRDGEYFDTPDAYLAKLDAEVAGEKFFYRAGPLDKKAISVTDDPDGASSGASSTHYVPDRILSFTQMKEDGYRLLSGARGMVGVTSAKEREFVWLKVE